ncbi:histidine kinase [Actinoplanes italicus]|uniref:histidine kinase n=1 Tax=Actinoplanes italicus TaxID=113567 RepID=A0A2T0K2U3_9ACTN|nr:PAS domain S-box protein [Actinoplanes italicus]PRX16893.1 PAS domain S-box-containing protein [Actinoplanes italicus]GIE30974.1 histidine kinase [Actinoplanes italicus]
MIMLPRGGAATAVAIAGAGLLGWLAGRLRPAPGDDAPEREMLAAVAEQSADAIIACTLDGTLTVWNKGAERLYGWAADEVLGRPFGDLLPADRGDALEHALAVLAGGGQIVLDETRRVHRDGTPFLVSVTVSPIRDRHGRVVAAAATERDVTERKRREAEERRAAERSIRAARLESLGHLAGGVAHDFNNLLAIILNYADFLADEVTGDAAADLSRIRDAAGRARSLTGQLLLFAKQEPTQVDVVDLNEVVTGSGELLARTIGAGIRLVCRPRQAAVPVRANRGRLDQILLNLVINARDAMPGGGVVMVETDCCDIRDEPAVPLPPGRYARLIVSDTGTGMTAEVRDRLFEPFFTTKPADRGTGLGLSTVYGVVGDAGGHISVESVLGTGTTFRILLPYAAGAPESCRPDPEPCARPGGAGQRVLVIEDEDYVRDLVVRILRENGYDTVAAGEDAVTGTDLTGVALLITDVVLPGRSGPAVADRLVQRHPGLRVLFMSGYSEAELRSRYDIPATTRMVQKPFTAVELLAAVGEALTGARPPVTTDPRTAG